MEDAGSGASTRHSRAACIVAGIKNTAAGTRAVSPRLADGALGQVIVPLGFVHGTVRVAQAAGHPGFRRWLPACAYGDVPDREGQNRRERR
jgi:hypothetical protein